MKAFFIFFRFSLQWIALLVPLLLCPGSTAAVTFTVTPSSVSNTYRGTITLQIGGLNNGETVQVDKYLDANANGAIDSSDLLVASFQLTDGQARVIGGLTNINVAYDSTPVDGAITTLLNFFTIDFFEHIVGKYIYRLSSPTGHFGPLTNAFTVTAAAYPQSVTGNVAANGTPLPNAVVFLLPPNGSPVAGTVANNAGTYTLKGPPGSYALVTFKAGYVGNFSKTADFTLNTGTTITTNLNLTPATRTVAGQVVDAANPSLGLPGLMLSVRSANNLMALAFMDTNGNFSAGVTSNQWQLGVHDESAAALGYLSFNNGMMVDTTTGNVTGVTVPLTKATALFYGTVTDAQNHQPLAGISVYDDDSNYNQYEGGWMTDLFGYYVVPAVGGVAGGWQISPDNSNPAFAHYVFSQVNTNISDSQAVRVDFVGVLGNHQISGSVKDATNAPIANVNVYAYITDGSGYNANANTDATGFYSFNVVNGNWTVGVCCSGSGDCLSGLGGYGCVNEQTVNIANNNGTANFSVPLAPYHITGFVKDNNNNPLANVNIYASATINGTQYNENGNADATGNYSLNVANGNWSVGICCSVGYNNCLPALGYQCVANQSVNIANNNGIANFTVYPASQSTAMITVQPNPGNGGTVSGSGTYAVGSSQPISANPYNGWTFTGWNDSNTQNPRTIIVPSGGATYTANFTTQAMQTAVITVLALPTRGGTVSGSGTYPVGSSQQISATANASWVFNGWTDSAGMEHPRTILVPDGGATYFANFIQPTQIVWNVALNGGPIYYSSPAIGTDGTIYVGSGAPFAFGPVRGLYAVNPNGTLKWQYTGTNQPNMYTPAIGADGTIYVQDALSTLYAISENGVLKWQYPLLMQTEVGQTAPAIAADGTIYAGADTLYAINPDGTLKWKNTHNGMGSTFIRSSPAIATNGTIYVGVNGMFGDPSSAFGNALLALNPDGSLQWECILQDSSWVFSSPAIGANGTIYIGAETDGDLSFVYAINPNGTLQWRYTVTGGRTIRSSPAVGMDGTIYIGTKASITSNAEFLALSPEGTLKWKFTIEGAGQDIYCSPTLGADGIIYFGAESSFLYAFNPNGTLAWKYNTSSGGINWTSPALSDDGILYIGNNAGHFFAIRSSSPGLAASPWPKFRHDNRNRGLVTAQPCSALQIQTRSPLPSGQVGFSINSQLLASGCHPPFTWSRISGALPTGINLAADGTVAGTPTNIGTYNFAVRVTDSAATTVDQSFTLTIQSNSSSSAVITVQANPNNGGTVSGGGTFNVGSSQSITAGANSGWTFAGWNDGGAQTHSVTVPTTNITYTAIFTQNGSVTSPTFSGIQGLYDLTGGFTNLSASFIAKDSRTVDISENLAVVQSVSGTLTSTGALTTVTIRPSDSDSFSFPVTATFKGAVKSAGSNLQIAFAFSGQGSAVSDGTLANYKESVSYSVTVNPATGIETGKKSGTASKSGSNGGAVKIIDTTIGPALFKFTPVGWYLSLSPTWNGTKVGGAATVYLTNGRSFPFTVKGTTKAGASKLTLTGTGTGKGATWTVTMTGTNHITGISGSLLGQKFNRSGL